MIVIVHRFLVPEGFNGITLWPFIILKEIHFKENAVLINHEKIHLRQQLELMLLFFYVWYAVEYLVRLVQYKNRNVAYKNISFEREAYKNESNLNYLKLRSFWGFMRFLVNEKQ